MSDNMHVLHNEPTDETAFGKENLRGKIIEHARRVAEFSKEDSKLDGFIMIGFFSDGTRSCGYRIPKRIPRELLPAYVAEILRTDAITGNEASKIMEEWM